MYEALVWQLEGVRDSISLLEASDAPRASEQALLQIYRRNEERLAFQVEVLHQQARIPVGRNTAGTYFISDENL
jgi:hypothetical protein